MMPSKAPMMSSEASMHTVMSKVRAKTGTNTKPAMVMMLGIIIGRSNHSVARVGIIIWIYIITSLHPEPRQLPILMF